jgi:hypothetical protein
MRARLAPLAFALAGAAIVLDARRADAGGDNLSVELRPVAQKIARFLASENQTAVRMGEVVEGKTVPMRSSAGPGIQHALAEELKQAKVSVHPDADYAIRGTYEPARDLATKQVIMALSFTITNKAGDEVLQGEKELQRGLFGDAAIGGIGGVNYAPPPGADRKTRDDYLEKAIEKPTATVKDGWVSPGPDTPYAIEVLVKKGHDYVPRPATLEGGHPYVHVDRGEVYGVRLHNASPWDALVTLTIDGLNMFSFSKLSYKQVLVPKRSSALVKGWHVDDTKSDEFVVTRYAESAAAMLKSTAGVGTISAAFSAAWEPDAAPPPDENDRCENCRDANATGRGATVGQKYVPVYRRAGAVRAVVSVRYQK